MKYLKLFLCAIVITSTVLASGSDPDWNNGEIVMYDVYASSDAGVTGQHYFDPFLQKEAHHWAYASVSAESGSEGYSSVWAEAGYDTDNSYEGGAYIAGSNGHSRYKAASSWVNTNNDPNNRFGYTFHSANINSQDDEDWSPKW
ncbi:MAG: hypothetical protein OXU51_09160 [Candidatus Poribacteria bacterium]|nr:hypothetical protein [Candidatus Poribacteria bacterium]